MFTGTKRHLSIGGQSYTVFYPNGYGASIIRNSFSYGGSSGLWELAVLSGTEEENHICYDTPITNNVVGYLSEKDVEELLLKIKALPNREEPKNV